MEKNTISHKYINIDPDKYIPLLNMKISNLRFLNHATFRFLLIHATVKDETTRTIQKEVPYN